MSAADDQEHTLRPTEQRGGTVPGQREGGDKGPWATKAGEGAVPPELGGSDAPQDMLPEDPQLGSEALGHTAHSEEPATDSGINRGGGDYADATSQERPGPSTAAEPDLKDAPSAPRQSDQESAE